MGSRRVCPSTGPTKSSMRLMRRGSLASRTANLEKDDLTCRRLCSSCQHSSSSRSASTSPRLVSASSSCEYVPRELAAPPALSTFVPPELTLAPPLALPEGVGDNLHLTHEQCEIAFPKFWMQLNRTRERFASQGGVRKEDVDRARGDDGTRVADCRRQSVRESSIFLLTVSRNDPIANSNSDQLKLGSGRSRTFIPST